MQKTLLLRLGCLILYEILSIPSFHETKRGSQRLIFEKEMFLKLSASFLKLVTFAPSKNKRNLYYVK